MLAVSYTHLNAPLAALKGAELAVKELGVSIVLCGNEAEIHRVAIQNDISLVGMERCV